MLHHKTLAELSQGLQKKEYSSEELTHYFLNRAQEHNKIFNAFITIDKEYSLKQAKHADQLRANGIAGALTGIPIAQKDIFCTKGLLTTACSKMLSNFISPYDATIIQKFNQAGSVILGKTNMDEFAMGSSNENSFYGPCRNPWNTDYIPGGSSGGSAAAVAARIAPAATGTDTGGSIRQPAAMCGITGLKPTYGRVSRYGMIAFASSLDQAGPMAQTAEDAALLLNVMAGFDEKDSSSSAKEVPDYTRTLNDNLQGLKIGLPKEYFNAGLDKHMAAKIEEAMQELKKLDATFHEISLPSSELAIAAYYVIAPAEASSNLSRFDGVRYGHRCANAKDLEDLYKRSRGEGFGKEVQRRILTGSYVLSSGYYDAYYLKAQKIRRLIANDFQAAFEKVDVILSPTTPTAAFKLGEKQHDPLAMYLSDIYTISTNLAGLPGLSMPIGFLNQLPVGMQLVGQHFSEARLLNIAHRYQQATNWHQQLPECAL